MAAVSMRDLLETGVHFGHRTRRWNPKMRPYIFTERNGIHILDLQQTLKALSSAVVMVQDLVAGGGTIMFVGTKRQAQETIKIQAERCGMPYVNQRWLGGTLTNWRTIRQRIDYLKDLEGRRDRGEFELLTKKEALMLSREIEKLTYRLSGIRDMSRVPDMLFVVDVLREHTAVREANILDIPILAVVDTNCDPDDIDYVVPANDDAIRAIKLMATAIADAVLEGVGLRKDEEVEEEGEDVDLEAMAEGTDEALLGEATLAKLREARLFDEAQKEKEAEDEEEAEAGEGESGGDEAPAAEAAEDAGGEEEDEGEDEEEGDAVAEAEEGDAEAEEGDDDAEAEEDADDGEAEEDEDEDEEE